MGMNETAMTNRHRRPAARWRSTPRRARRALRVAAGLTQVELAEGRFSKEYISQIERGKTRPTEATIAWLAERLGVDPGFISSGSRPRSARRSRRCSLAPRRSPRRTTTPRPSTRSARHGPRERGRRLRAPRPLRRGLGAPAEREINPALELLQQARELAEAPEFSDVDRADVLFRLGVCRYKLSSIGTAVALFDEALALAERSGLPCDLLRADILGWRSRCHRLQRDYVAAHEDVERALELAQDLGDRRAIANTYFLASLIAQRQGHWVLSRNYAQRAKDLYQELNDERNVGRLLLALGGLTLLLGDEDQAVEHLKASFSRALESDSPPDAAQALQGLARVHLNRGEYDQADELARKALALLDGREDYLHEVCPSQLVLGRALMERGRFEEAGDCFRAADAAAEQLASISHRAEAWVALGDLAARRGDDRESARLYRNAAEALQEIRF